MKKKYFILSTLFLLTACGGNPDTSSLNIVSPSGAPAVAFYNEAKNERFETNSNPSNIIAMMTEASDKDIVVIDTVSGIQAIQNGAPYSLAANITFGNFYIAATGNDDNTIMDGDDKIVLFGQGKTSDFIFHYIYGDQFDANIEYVPAVKDAAACLATGKNAVTSSSIDYVFVAEPVLFATLNNTNAATYGKASVYANIQELYQEKTGGLSLIQASVFVRNATEKKVLKAYLSDLEENIKKALENPVLVEEGMNQISLEQATALYGIAPTVAKAVLANGNRLGLGYKEAIENKEAIDQFIQLFSLGPTNEEIYF